MIPPGRHTPPPGGPSRVIQGSFPGGRPRILQLRSAPAPAQPARPAPPPAMPAARPNSSAQPKPMPGRPGGPASHPRPSRPGSTPPMPARPMPGRPAAPIPNARAHRPAALQPAGAGNAFSLPPSFRLRPAGTGQRLPEAVQRKMEGVLGADFSGVRVHVGPEASSIGALAFTVGSDLYFAPGQYNPGSSQGQQLLGHELTHVVQQRAGRVRGPMGSVLAVVQDAALEAEADRVGQRAAAAAATVQAKGTSAADRRTTHLPRPGPLAVQSRMRLNSFPRSQLRLLQAKLICGASATAIRDLNHFFEYLKSAKVSLIQGKEYLFFNKSEAAWKNKGLVKSKQAERDAYMKEALDATSILIGDDSCNVEGITPDDIKEKIILYMNYLKSLNANSGTNPTTTNAVSGVNPSTAGEKSEESVEKNPNTHIENMKNKLVESGRAFPGPDIVKSSRLASLPGGDGHAYELKLAVSALEELPNSMVQFGALGKAEIEENLKKSIAAHEKPRQGRIGADITVWTPTPDGKMGGDFVQAKSIIFTSLKSEVTKACSQLAGENAHSNRIHNAMDRENSLKGDSHLGSIFVQIKDGVKDLDVLQDVARDALRSPYVRSIVVTDLLDGKMYVTDKTEKNGELFVLK